MQAPAMSEALSRFRRWAEGQTFEHDRTRYRIRVDFTDRLTGYPTDGGPTVLDLDALDPAHPVLMRLYRRFERHDFAGADPELHPYCAECEEEHIRPAC